MNTNLKLFSQQCCFLGNTYIEILLWKIMHSTHLRNKISNMAKMYVFDIVYNNMKRCAQLIC